MRPVRRIALALALVGVWASASSAGEVRFPLTVDYEMLRIAIRKHLHEDAGGQLTVRASADGCRTLTVREVTMYPAGGRLRIATRASARVGFGFLGWCWAHTSWEGHLDVTARPDIDRSWTLRIHELDAQLYDINRQQGGVTERIFDLAKGWAESELATFTFDLGPPVQEIKALLGAFATPSRAAPVATAAGHPAARWRGRRQRRGPGLRRPRRAAGLSRPAEPGAPARPADSSAGRRRSTVGTASSGSSPKTWAAPSGTPASGTRCSTS